MAPHIPISFQLFQQILRFKGTGTSTLVYQNVFNFFRWSTLVKVHQGLHPAGLQGTVLPQEVVQDYAFEEKGFIIFFDLVSILHNTYIDQFYNPLRNKT